MRGLLTQQVREPHEEQQYRGSIARLTSIDDDVSLLVKRQYEENPYPRWVSAPSRHAPTTVDAFLRNEFPSGSFRALGKSDIDILVAGCGTGWHAIYVAQQFKGARVLAVDLSLSSLCYARRKTRAAGLHNIEYAQADILKLRTAGRTFDVIDASGVLHHLADPMRGWSELLALLRPGGFMHLGLYSELGRRDIAAARTFIAERGYRPTADDIRRCRHELTSAPEGIVARRYDFFATSDCRDLLFHVQEHPTTIPAIGSFLTEGGLTFIGFELVPAVRQQYSQRFAEDITMSDLHHWHVFETEKPDTFADMYRFWIQKN